MTPDTAASITALDQAHQWIHDATEVLILKCVKADGSSYGGFQWPLTVDAVVEAATWTGASDCQSGGLFGWPWGFGLGDGKELDWSGKWIVFGAQIADIVGNIENQRKCKARCGVIRFVGDWHAAMQFILEGQMALVAHLASHATGYSSASSATGDSSASMVTGLYGRVRAGKYGCLALAWWNEKESRGEMRCREIGSGDGSDGKLKADTWYHLNEAGEFEEVSL